MTIDIPEPMYSALQNSAEQANTSVPDLLLRKIVQLGLLGAKSAKPGNKVDFPLIRGAEPGPLMRADVNLNHVAWMNEEEVYELLAGR